MIPWMREKFSERRAKWQAARSKRNDAKAADAMVVTTSEATAAATDVNLVDPTNSSSTARNSRLQELPASPQRAVAVGAACSVLEGRVFTNAEPMRPTIVRRPSNASTGTQTPPQSNSSKLSKLRSSAQRNSSSSCQNSSLNLHSSSDSPAAGSKEKLKIRIICPSARLLVFQTDSNKRIVELKNEVILELSDDPASMPHFATDVRQLSPRYRLVRADYEGAELLESMTLAQVHVQNNDTLALVARRSHLAQASLQTRELHPPREQEIEEATCNIMRQSADMPMVDINEIFQQSNLQFDVRKVLISLAQASAGIIGAGPYAARLIDMLKQKLINKRNYQNDTLQCLVDMGFARDQAEVALKIHHGVYSTALEYLIQRQSIDLSAQPALRMQKSQSIASPSGILTDNGIIANTEALLEIVRIYSHRDIPPTPDTVTALVEMGFDEQDVLQALKKTCNNKAAACEWLCGNRSGSLVELRDGLALDSPILKSILELPQVQLNLNNPKIFLAFLCILENENSIRVWGGDSDTTSVITHILQKYHEEKHVLGINQFYSNR